MSQKIKGLFLLICAAGVLVLALSFFSRGTPIEVQMPLVTKQMVEEKQAQLKSEAEQLSCYGAFGHVVLYVHVFCL